MTLTKILEHILKAIQDMGMTEVQSKIDKCVKVESQTLTSEQKAQARTNIGAIAEIPTASADTLGGVKVGSNLSIANGVLSAAGTPVATADTLGGIKVGTGLSINEAGVLSASGGSVSPIVVEGAYDVDSHVFSPNAGQPSFSAAKEAFLAGIPVFIKALMGDSTTYVTTQVLSYGGDSAAYGLGLCTVFYYPDSDNVSISTACWFEPAE